MTGQVIGELKREIAEKSLQAYRAGLFSGTSGNMSCYLHDEGKIPITPTSVRYETLRPEDIVVMRLDGTVLEGRFKPSSEWRMHAVIYEKFPKVSAVFHTHSPYATAFAAVRKSIPAILIESRIFLGGEIRCAEYATPGTREVGLAASEVLEGRGGCTLSNHGVLAVGSDLAEAYLRAEYIEDTAKIYTYAKSIGEPVELTEL